MKTPKLLLLLASFGLLVSSCNQPAQPSKDPSDPVEPGTDPVDPGTDPVDPGTDPVDPGTDPVDPEPEPFDVDTVTPRDASLPDGGTKVERNPEAEENPDYENALKDLSMGILQTVTQPTVSLNFDLKAGAKNIPIHKDVKSDLFVESEVTISYALPMTGDFDYAYSQIELNNLTIQASNVLPGEKEGQYKHLDIEGLKVTIHTQVIEEEKDVFRTYAYLDLSDESVEKALESVLGEGASSYISLFLGQNKKGYVEISTFITELFNKLVELMSNSGNEEGEFEPSEPEEPGDQVEPEEPGDPAEPAELEEPADPADPEEPVDPVDPEEPEEVEPIVDVLSTVFGLVSFAVLFNAGEYATQLASYVAIVQPELQLYKEEETLKQIGALVSFDLADLMEMIPSQETEVAEPAAETEPEEPNYALKASASLIVGDTKGSSVMALEQLFASVSAKFGEIEIGAELSLNCSYNDKVTFAPLNEEELAEYTTDLKVLFETIVSVAESYIASQF